MWGVLLTVTPGQSLLPFPPLSCVSQGSMQNGQEPSDEDQEQRAGLRGQSLQAGQHEALYLQLPTVWMRGAPRAQTL